MPDSSDIVVVDHAELVTALVVQLRTKVPDRLLKQLVRQPDSSKRAIDPTAQVDAAKRELIEILVSEVFDRARWTVTRQQGRGGLCG
jgi:hypothetical protein